MSAGMFDAWERYCASQREQQSLADDIGGEFLAALAQDDAGILVASGAISPIELGRRMTSILALDAMSDPRPLTDALVRAMSLGITDSAEAAGQALHEFVFLLAEHQGASIKPRSAS